MSLTVTSPGLVITALGPVDNPFSLASRLRPLPHLLLLESQSSSETTGYYSYITADPKSWFSDAQPFSSIEKLGPFLGTLPHEPALPPFQTGLAGYLGFETGTIFEPKIPLARYDEFQLPRWALGLYDFVIAVDHRQNQAWLISSGVSWNGEQLDFSSEWAERRSEQILSLLESTLTRQAPHFSTHPLLSPITPSGLYPQEAVAGLPGVTSNYSREGFEAAIRRGIEYIHAGDIFQVNLAQRLLAPQVRPAWDIYGQMRELNRVGYSGFFDAVSCQLLCSSPEEFLKLDVNRQVRTRPIKGTRPRLPEEQADQAQQRQLLESAKDRAENIMIVDLLRNDLGRVCDIGTVTVDKICELESYQYVHHLVSQVSGRLRPSLTAFDLLRGTFPGGSITGAPKIRAMQIIAELEPTQRGPYCGSLGYLSLTGPAEFNILIRTITASRGWLQFPVGAGIVADSQPTEEYEETMHKAKGMLRTILS